jgi:enoyl-CoA hydratase/carnithine racemase
VPVAELRAFAEGQAAKLVALPASSIRVTKELMKAARKAPVSEAIAAENIHFGKMLSSPEAREAFMAFFQKRKPDFKQFS